MRRFPAHLTVNCPCGNTTPTCLPILEAYKAGEIDADEAITLHRPGHVKLGGLVIEDDGARQRTTILSSDLVLVKDRMVYTMAQGRSVAKDPGWLDNVEDPEAVFEENLEDEEDA